LPAPVLAAEGLSLAHGRHQVVHELDLRIEPGVLTALVGPNGSGKTTVLRGLAGLLKPAAGSVTLDGTPLLELRPRERARLVAYLPQSPVVPVGLSVREVVELGRHPHRGWFGGERGEPAVVTPVSVDDALEAAGVATLATRPIEQVSGGERQRVWLATALAQSTPILLLDEPTTFLDVRHQLDLLALLREQVDRHGRTVVGVFHDLNHAVTHADQVVALAAGRVVAAGAPVDVMSSPALPDAFEVEVIVGTDPADGAPICFFRRRTAPADPSPET
jgi:iron complex transport system ATP-binding protein